MNFRSCWGTAVEASHLKSCQATKMYRHYHRWRQLRFSFIYCMCEKLSSLWKWITALNPICLISWNFTDKADKLKFKFSYMQLRLNCFGEILNYIGDRHCNCSSISNIMFDSEFQFIIQYSQYIILKQWLKFYLRGQNEHNFCVPFLLHEPFIDVFHCDVSVETLNFERLK